MKHALNGAKPEEENWRLSGVKTGGKRKKDLKQSSKKEKQKLKNLEEASVQEICPKSQKRGFLTLFLFFSFVPFGWSCLSYL